ncbi:MAG: adenine phosphoribosyltransferase [Clostridia bacterium]
MDKKELSSLIVNVKDYPRSGILFKDITPMLNNAEAYNYAIDEMLSIIKKLYPDVTHIVSPEARGFCFGCPIAVRGGYNFVPVRKPKKLPRETNTVTYDLEYDTETLCIHKDALKEGDVVVAVDDILATGGTVMAIETLVKDSKATLKAFVLLGEIKGLLGSNFTKLPIHSVVEL